MSMKLLFLFSISVAPLISIGQTYMVIDPQFVSTVDGFRPAVTLSGGGRAYHTACQINKPFYVSQNFGQLLPDSEKGNINIFDFQYYEHLTSAKISFPSESG